MFAAALTLLVACARSNNASGRDDPGAYRGAVLDPAGPKLDFTLTDTRGQRFQFRKATDGYVTLLFFGYTNCPDVCPLHMANIAAVLNQLPPDVVNKVKVVFVTTDPARDTAQRLRSWLDNFDARFIGLTGAPDSIQALEHRLGLPPSAPEAHQPDGSYTVGHAAYVIAFTPDNRERVLYGFGTRQVDWAHDLPMLAENQ